MYGRGGGAAGARAASGALTRPELALHLRPEVEVEVGREERAQEQQGQQAVPAQPGHGPSRDPENTWGADGRSSWSPDGAGMLTQGISSSWKGVSPELGDRVQEAHSLDSVVFSRPVETRGWGSLATRLLFESLCPVTPSFRDRSGGEVPVTRVLALVTG